jgi:uncharacterized protein YlxW (UPF0749 family)
MTARVAAHSVNTLINTAHLEVFKITYVILRASVSVELPNILRMRLRVLIATIRFTPKGWTMQEVAPRQTWSNRFDVLDRDSQLKQELDSLQSENTQLKKLVVRLSETIIRNVTTKPWPSRKSPSVQS